MTSLVSSPSFEDKVTGIIHDKLSELYSKGYTTDQASAAVKRSRQWAARMSAMLSEDIRDQAFIDFFNKSLLEADNWIERYKSGMSK